MANNLPTRRCDGCGQIWSSGSFLDPTTKADCGFCGASLPHRRRLPDGVGIEIEQLRESTLEQLPLPPRAAVG
ncbi:MAG: hypothetical protein H0T69_17610 [Thermoleophilaceae bacterium]|nr:hypothetical protein [Thermoleophilaceae bacterium]